MRVGPGGRATERLDAAAARRRFLILRALRWLPTGLLVPVLVVLLLERGLTLAQIGLVTAAQGLVVLALELPTGGLADVWGRRPVLLAATLFDLTTVALLTFADSLAVLAVAFGLQGVYRALESGPLDSWYVDTVLAADPQADLESGLAAGGTVLGVAISAGSLASSALVAVGPLGGLDPLLIPLVVALVLRLVEAVAIWALMAEPPDWRAPTSIGVTLRQVPGVVAIAVRTVRGSRVLTALLAIELLWGLGMVAFETFTPARLEQILAGPDRAATWLGPANTGAWLAAAVGAAAVPALTRRLGPPRVGALLRLAQGSAVAAIGLVAGPLAVVAAYITTMAVHGASNPVHQGLLHRAVTDPHRRATVVSANSMTANLGAIVGGVALGALADVTTLTTAITAGAFLLAAAAPLYRAAGQTLR